MAADDIGTIGEPVRMLVIGGTEQQSGGVDRAARRDHDVSRNFLASAVALDNHFADLAARWAGLEPFHVSVRPERYISMFERRIDGADLRVGFGANQTRESVTAVAANAAARMRILFVEHHAKWRVKRAQAELREIIG